MSRRESVCRVVSTLTIMFAVIPSGISSNGIALAQSECPEPPDALVEDSISEVGNDPAVAIDT